MLGQHVRRGVKDTSRYPKKDQREEVPLNETSYIHT